MVVVLLAVGFVATRDHLVHRWLFLLLRLVQHCLLAAAGTLLFAAGAGAAFVFPAAAAAAAFSYCWQCIICCCHCWCGICFYCWQCIIGC